MHISFIFWFCDVQIASYTGKESLLCVRWKQKKEEEGKRERYRIWDLGRTRVAKRMGMCMNSRDVYMCLEEYLGVPSEEFELTASTQQAHMKPHG